MKPAIVARNPGTGEPDVARAMRTIGAVAAYEKSAGVPSAQRRPASLATGVDFWLKQQEGRSS